MSLPGQKRTYDTYTGIALQVLPQITQPQFPLSYSGVAAYAPGLLFVYIGIKADYTSGKMLCILLWVSDMSDI